MSHTHDYEFQTAPSRFLVDHIGLLPPKGHVLDIAMGSGRNAVYLAKLGFEVEGVDSSEHAVDHARKLAEENGVTIRTSVADLENDYHIKQDNYDAIICFNYLQRSLIPQIKAGIKIGGVIMYETFTIDQLQFGHPHNPDFLLKHNELLDMFKDFRCLRYREGIIRDSTTKKRKAVASLIAVKI